MYEYVCVCMQKLKKLVFAMLNNARALDSIALAAFGTGNLNYPPELVAQMMYTAVEEFDAAATGASLKEVNLVVYHKAPDLVFRVFEIVHLFIARMPCLPFHNMHRRIFDMAIFEYVQLVTIYEYGIII